MKICRQKWLSSLMGVFFEGEASYYTLYCVHTVVNYCHRLIRRDRQTKYCVFHKMVTFSRTFWDCSIVHAHIEDTGSGNISVDQWASHYLCNTKKAVERIVRCTACWVGLVRLYWVQPTVAVQVHYTSYFLYYNLQNHPQLSSVDSSLPQTKLNRNFGHLFYEDAVLWQSICPY